MIGGKIYLTCIDAFTKFAQAIHINSKNAVELVDAMITYFSMYGIPEEIVMDGGKRKRYRFFAGIGGSTGDVTLTEIKKTTGLLPVKLGTAWNTVNYWEFINVHYLDTLLLGIKQLENKRTLS
ncbi:hypothetical protein QE152_g37358 [Popillia japonica]|uniref:Integrase catalytic domain-containing protein n=1 Tax=Popillia japonica TaxID=7064 RepID=A0AAW1IAF6_POPJA